MQIQGGDKRFKVTRKKKKGSETFKGERTYISFSNYYSDLDLRETEEFLGAMKQLESEVLGKTE